MLKILTVPDETEILRRKSEPVAEFDKELAEFLRELGETLKSQKHPAGVGLSAIQVGKPIRAFVLYLPEVPLESKSKIKNQKSKITFYINPEIVGRAAEMTLGEDLVKSDPPKATHSGGQKRLTPFLEGCLSIPRIYGAVLRWPWIKVKYQILSGGEVSDTLQGLSARVFQHELDHLNGILFTDHVLAQGNKLFREEGKEMVALEM